MLDKPETSTKLLHLMDHLKEIEVAIKAAFPSHVPTLEVMASAKGIVHDFLMNDVDEFTMDILTDPCPKCRQAVGQCDLCSPASKMVTRPVWVKWVKSNMF